MPATSPDPTSGRKPSRPAGTRPAPRPIAVATGFGALGCFSLIAGGLISNRPTPTDRLLPGTQIADIAVGDLPVDEARERLRQWARGRMGLPVQVRHPDSNKTWKWSIADISGRFEIEDALQEALQHARDENLLEHWWYRDTPRDIQIVPKFVYNPGRLRRRLEVVARQVDIPPINAKLGVVPKQGFQLVRKERSGVQLDVAATATALDQDDLSDGAEAELTLREALPKVDSRMLAGMGTLLAAYSTYYGSSSANRKHNVATGASAIDGTWLENGASFSFNKTVGPRIADRGWRLAHQFQDGQVVDGIGGGVCQVSSTLYNAVLLGGLAIRERHNHSMPVAYLNPGRDATVSYGALDFRFENNTGGPVYLQATADGKRLTFRVLGPRPLPHSVRVVAGPTVPKAGGAFTVQTFREWVTANRLVRREDLGKDTYKPHPPEPTPAKPPGAVKKVALAKPKPKASRPVKPPSAPPPPDPQATGTEPLPPAP